MKPTIRATYDPAPFALVQMLMRQLRKDLLIFDLETSDLLFSENFGVTEIATLRIPREGPVVLFSQRVNPERPISPKAAEITGISDADVADEAPYGKHLAVAMCRAASDCVVSGFNIRGFDLPGIVAIHERYGFPVPRFLEVLDVREIWRELSKARNYKGKGTLTDLMEAYKLEIGDAHAAEEDVVMTGMLLNEMIWRHGADAIIALRVLDAAAHVHGAIESDGLSEEPKAIAKGVLLRNRLSRYFAEGGVYEGKEALCAALSISKVDAMEADMALSDMIRAGHVEAERMLLEPSKTFLEKHLLKAIEKLNFDPMDTGILRKEVLKQLRMVRSCPKELDYIQLNAALAILQRPAPEGTPSSTAATPAL